MMIEFPLVQPPTGDGATPRGETAAATFGSLLAAVGAVAPHPGPGPIHAGPVEPHLPATELLLDGETVEAGLVTEAPPEAPHPINGAPVIDAPPVAEGGEAPPAEGEDDASDVARKVAPGRGTPPEWAPAHGLRGTQPGHATAPTGTPVPPPTPVAPPADETLPMPGVDPLPRGPEPIPIPLPPVDGAPIDAAVAAPVPPSAPDVPVEAPAASVSVAAQAAPAPTITPGDATVRAPSVDTPTVPPTNPAEPVAAALSAVGPTDAEVPVAAPPVASPLRSAAPPTAPTVGVAQQAAAPAMAPSAPPAAPPVAPPPTGGVDAPAPTIDPATPATSAMPAAGDAPATPTGSATPVADPVTGRLPSAAAMRAVERVAEVARALESAPPPRAVTIVVEELADLPVRVALRGTGLEVTATPRSTQEAMFLEEVRGQLAERGFDLTEDREGRGRRGEAAREDESWRSGPQRRRTGNTGLRL